MADETGFSFCEPPHQTGTRWHIRANEGVRYVNGGIPKGHGTALCGLDVAGGWDIATDVSAQVVRALLDRNRDARTGSEQAVHEACASRFLQSVGGA